MEKQFVLRHGAESGWYAIFDGQHQLLNVLLEESSNTITFTFPDNAQIELQLNYPSSFIGREIIYVRFRDHGKTYCSEIDKLYIIFNAVQKMDMATLGSKHSSAALKVGLAKTILSVDGVEIGRLASRKGDDLYQLAIKTDKVLTIQDYLLLNSLCFFHYLVNNIRSFD